MNAGEVARRILVADRPQRQHPLAPELAGGVEIEPIEATRQVAGQRLQVGAREHGEGLIGIEGHEASVAVAHPAVRAVEADLARATPTAGLTNDCREGTTGAFRPAGDDDLDGVLVALAPADQHRGPHALDPIEGLPAEGRSHARQQIERLRRAARRLRPAGCDGFRSLVGRLGLAGDRRRDRRIWRRKCSGDEHADDGGDHDRQSKEGAGRRRRGRVSDRLLQCVRTVWTHGVGAVDGASVFGRGRGRGRRAGGASSVAASPSPAPSSSLPSAFF